MSLLKSLKRGVWFMSSNRNDVETYYSNCLTKAICLHMERSLKYDINKLDTAYDKLFDNLIPTKYKYLHGTSGRYHTGFIAQEVVNAIESSGLTTQDFAGVMLAGKREGEKESYWYLRRDEFIALNTWQIQMLKNRVAELENIISQLQQNLTAD